MVEAGVVLVTGEVADVAKRGGVEPVAVAVEVVFGVIFIPLDGVAVAELVGFGPGAGFNLNEFDVARVGLVADKIVAEFV